MLKSSDRAQHDLDLLQHLEAAAAQQHDTARGPAAQAPQGTAGPPPAVPLSGGATEAEAATEPSSAAAVHLGASGVQGGGVGRGGTPPLALTLVLRRWHDLRPEREFRCFVRRGELVAACQRDVSQHFHGLRGLEGEVRHALWAFHRGAMAAALAEGALGLADCECGTVGAPCERVSLADGSAGRVGVVKHGRGLDLRGACVPGGGGRACDMAHSHTLPPPPRHTPRDQQSSCWLSCQPQWDAGGAVV